MARRLPDELLHDILGNVLHVSNVRLCRDHTSTLALDFWESSVVLLVCKRWLRIATPLLYETVMIRNIAQAQALEDTLTNNLLLATFVKRFRIEGTWTSLYPILTKCTNIKVFVMVMNVYSTDPESGLCRGLFHINPEEVQLYPFRSHKNVKMRRIITAFGDAIQDWTKMTKFIMPRAPRGLDLEADLLFQSLSASSSLQEYHYGTSLSWPHALDVLLANPAVSFHFMSDNFPSHIPQAAVGRTYLSTAPSVDTEYHHQPQTMLIPKGPVSMRPLFTEPKSRTRRIWETIFAFAAFPAEVNGLGDTFYDRIEESEERRAFSLERNRLGQVSRLFRVLVNLCEMDTPLLMSQNDLFALANHLVHGRESRFANSVHNLTIDFTVEPDSQAEVDAALDALLQRLTGLRRLAMYSENRLPLPSFSTLARFAGASLSYLEVDSIESRGNPVSVCVWNDFIMLQHLRVSELPPFHFHASAVAPTCLQRLESLVFDAVQRNFDLAELFAYVRLPNLRVLHLGADSEETLIVGILRSCGARITELKLYTLRDDAAYNYCPLLQSLRIVGPFFHLFVNWTWHANLERVQLDDSDDIEQSLQNPETISFFERLDFRGFPKMSKLVLSEYQWPLDERGIKDADMPFWSVKLKEIFDVDVVDGRGRTWRPRLQRRR